MIVEVKIVGGLLRPGGQGQLKLELEPGTTVGQMLGVLGYPEGQARFILAAVNNDLQEHDHPLNPGDQVTLALLVGGG